MLIEVQDVSAGYNGVAIIQGATFSAEPASSVLIRGGNGTGKSTLLKALCGRTPSVSGTILFEGERVGCRPFSKRYLHESVYLAPQSRNVFEELTVTENLEVASRAHRWQGSEAWPESVSSFVTQFSRVRAGLLSGGQRKVLSIAMAVASQAPLLLLDEPLAGLSEGNGLGDAVVDLLIRTQQGGRTLIIAEHREAHLVKAAEMKLHMQILEIDEEGRISSSTTEVSHEPNRQA